MGRLSRFRLAQVAPIAAAATIAATVALPLSWPTAAAAAAVLVALPALAARGGRAFKGPNLTVVAAACLSIVGLISLAYAAFALRYVGAFGPVRRLAYPFLIATGLRRDGAVWLLLLTGTVSTIPLLFEDTAGPLDQPAVEPAFSGARVASLHEARERLLPRTHLDAR